MRSVFSQDYPKDSYEVIIVDNNSKDNTWRVADKLRRNSPVAYSYLVESAQGLSHARNCGIKSARNDFVVYLDDDATAERNWLAVFSDTVQRLDADVVGGKIVPIPEDGTTMPPWFETPYVKGFFGLDWASMGYGDGVLEIRFPLYIGGGNSCTRKSLFGPDGPRYDAKLGRTGGRHLQGEETLINFLFEKAGYKIYYNPDAVIYHFFGPDRVDRRHMVRKAFWGGYSDAWMHKRMFGSRFVITSGPHRFRDSFRAYLNARRRSDDSVSFEKKCLLAHDLGYVLRIGRVWELI